ncbi:aminotransferase [Paenibacillus odorifer]|uniref:DegT/DnrJ/EryC1/StrS family aminotransferase n=1 Tax=Paenibacillus TaxID=44249 RepID=UPI0003E2A6B1|nr:MULTISPECIES: DegT/DnrJ/EryC1/StrS family aminotransferase [Paenibacillus]ETT65586.1 DegT/DnrJ/EryC1/StrS aminotransferase [Paenibacillus sp. FSL H8-237]OME56561.1 aminotransferase [Paenibacillus odorifer]OME59133.1 aminotransferase [Paenibacillus odorifer]
MNELIKLETPVNVTKTYMPPFSEFTAEIERLWNNSWITNNGELHQEFEKKLIDFLSINNVSLLVNGHMALETAIKTLGITGEVITTPFTFASTTHAIVNNNLKPVFCDIDLSDYNIDCTKIEALINENTSAIMPVHVFGTPCNVDAIERIAQKYNLKVLYDAAHAFGVEINGKPISQFGDISMFSLHATKLFHSIEGGVLVYKNDEYKRIIDLYKNFGISGPETVEIVGYNAKMNEFQAAMGLVNLNHVQENIEKRKLVTERYVDLLGEIPGISLLDYKKSNIVYNYSYFPIVIDKEKYGVSRNTLYEILRDNNIFTRKYFYPLATDYSCFKEEYSNIELPNAKKISDNILTLPIYPDLSYDIVDLICKNIDIIHRRSL